MVNPGTAIFVSSAGTVYYVFINIDHRRCANILFRHPLLTIDLPNSPPPPPVWHSAKCRRRIAVSASVLKFHRDRTLGRVLDFVHSCPLVAGVRDVPIALLLGSFMPVACIACRNPAFCLTPTVPQSLIREYFFLMNQSDVTSTFDLD
jgi:hypothetical protein